MAKRESKEERLERFYDLVEKIETAMFTTRRADGYLVSRPMATQARAEGADLWFVTEKTSPKVQEIKSDAHVNLAYFNNRSREWISVSGTARIVRDRDKIRELWRPDWRAWFGDEGGENHGTPDDPRIVLIGVKIRFAVFLELNKPQPVVLFEVAKGIVTGHPPDFDPPKRISGEELRETARKTKMAKRDKK
jgi:general stress protein 26